MAFSELELLSGDARLEYDGERLSLSGVKRGFSAVVADDQSAGEYILTIFAKVPANRESEVGKRVNFLAENLPKNALLSLKSEVNYLQLRFLSGKLFQENGALLVSFADELCGFLEEGGFGRTELYEKACYPEKPAKAEKKEKSPVRFDKYSVRGFIAALLGAFACAVIQGISVNVSGENTLMQVAGFVIGLAGALIVLADYRFAARKLDIFGIISTTALIALFILSGCYFSHISTVNTLVGAATGEAPGIAAVMRDYPILAAKLTDEARTSLAEFSAQVALMDVIGAAIGAAVFYVRYFRKNADQMYEGKTAGK